MSKFTLIITIIILRLIIASLVFADTFTAWVELPSKAEEAALLSLAGSSIVLTFKDQWAGKAEEEELGEVMPPLLRFPAGLHAMFYDWETGRYTNAKFLKKENTAINSVDEFFRLANKYEAQVSYVVNLNEDCGEKTGKLARYIKSKGYSVRYWELGNEAAGFRYNKRFSNADEYLRVAETHALKIRAVFPTAEFGVTAQNRRLRSNSWNRHLAKQHLFKNIVIHRYHGPTRSERQKMDKRGEQLPALRVYEQMLRNSIPEPLKYKDTFPGKQFWISEWAPLYLKTDMQNSMAHAIWMARTFVSYLRTPEIKMACYWNLSTRPFGLIHSIDEKFVRRVPFYVYKMVVEQLRRFQYTAPLRLRIQANAVKRLDGQYFKDENGYRSALLVNASGHKYVIKFPMILGNGASAEVLGSDNFNASNGHFLALSSLLRNQKTELVRPERYDVNGDSISLPPFAVAAVKWRVERSQ